MKLGFCYCVFGVFGPGVCNGGLLDPQLCFEGAIAMLVVDPSQMAACDIVWVVVQMDK